MKENVAYCGLVCGVCKHTEKGCPGCRNGGGDESCHQRACCVENALDGCWQCDGFPCDKGFFADDAWKGLCIGSIQCIKDMGREAFVERVESGMGQSVEYGDYRFKSAEDVRTLLNDSEK